MAGSLTAKTLKEIPSCPQHGPCFVKTGTKPASFGLCFFICSKCSFSKTAPKDFKTVCPKHEQLVELKAVNHDKTTTALRCYFRCIQGKQLGERWCGHQLVPVNSPKPIDKLKDVTNAHDAVKDKEQPAKPKQKEPIQNIPKTNRESDNSKHTNKDVRTEPSSEDEKASSDKNAKEDQPLSTGNTKSSTNDKQAAPEANKDNNKPNDVIKRPSSDSVSVENQSEESSVLPHSFYEMRSSRSRVSDVSNASSHDSSHSSTTSEYFQQEQNKVNNSSSTTSNNKQTIEILSSDEDEDDGLPKAISSSTASNNKQLAEEFSHMNIMDAASHERELKTLEFTLKGQQQLLKFFGPKTADGGQKMKDKIDQITKRIDYLHSHPPEPDTGSETADSSLKVQLPSMGAKMLEHPPPPPMAGHGAQKEYFGGRMTSKRLQEVGKMTKEAIEHLHKSLDTCPAPHEEAEDPEKLKVTLMTHQRQALAWLTWRETQIPSGGILADDMGLGKTLTMISLTLKSKQKNLSKLTELPKDSKLIKSKSTIIVCPASLVHQWHKEIEKRVEKLQLRVHLYHGPNRETRPNRLVNYDIVLTTYNIVSIEGKPFIEEEKEKNNKPALGEWLDSTQPKKAESGPIFKVFWRRIILDEGHTIKNHKTNVSIAICSLEAESRWVVTGTPIQNNTMDLYSLIKFLRVSPFNELKFWKHEVDNKTASGRKRMNSIVTSILLRRTKDQNDAKTGKPLVSLPKRSCIVHKLKLSESEKDVYEVMQKFSKNMFTQFMNSKKDGESTSSKKHQLSDSEMPKEILGMDVDELLKMIGLSVVNARNAGCLLVLVLRLRQCCSHMSLMCQPLDSDLCKSEGIDIPLEEQLGNMSIDESSPMFSRPTEFKGGYASTKIQTLLKELKSMGRTSQTRKPIKSVVVSQWTRMLEIVASHLKRSGIKYEFITGSVNAKKRADIVEDFNNEIDPQVMLVSLKAGGVGLNLIGGSHLFLMDQHWNPSLEDQACDRIYRVGQLNDCVIHKFLCEDTVEERIVQLQEKKKALADTVLYGGKSQKLTLDDLKLIFGIGSR